ncbi:MULTISPECIES: RrF2 family transcriptional regulator [Caproicibacterium]|uniref:Rrf2 family transcriptional regulator n=1 Tax=Caproicibacterium argilliputei TaxID=3030016 RepID=A0AA97D7P3_9FIRM|nr:Rrf2 family transcriptional regulator [Caproicibacterium argilliputei]WOC31194.1 Rrf2 family transcriptional regulator [Caproicibacterium argilliputei]
MVITLETDYAVRIVELLTRAEGKTDARTIAEKTLVTQRFTLKILHKLVNAGLVTSFKGAHGGYMLARPPEKITLLQVIEAVEGPYMFSRCQQETYNCNHSCTTSCRFHEIYDEVTVMVRDKLRSYTFAETDACD